MSLEEAKECFQLGSPKQTTEDILGVMPDGSTISLPEKTRLNHNIAVFGASGTGKSRSMSRNSILQACRRGDSIIINDCKSELYESMSQFLRDRNYVVKVFNLIHPECSDSWNCIREIKDELMAQTFADVVLKSTSGEITDAFWFNAELNLLKALVLYVAFELPEKQRTFGKVYDMIVNENERSLNKIMSSIRHEHVNPLTGEIMPPSPAFAPFAIFMQSSETVRTSVITVQSEDVLCLKKHTDGRVHGSQFANISNTVKDISSKSGYALCHNQVDFSIVTVTNHANKTIPVLE